jgi:uncharacterized protein YbjT (DUF2867 family)
MKIVVTGSLGHISKPLAQELIQKGHEVTIISSNPEKQGEIENLGATAAIGKLDDTDFLIPAFTGADAVYCMVPPSHTETDQVAYYKRLGTSYVAAIRQAEVKRVVDLSSYGAHLEKGTGFIVGAHHVEKIMEQLPAVAITHMRPGFFYYNLMGFVGMIKAAGFIGANYGGEDRLPMVAPVDIAAAIADEITKPASGINVRYVISDDRSCSEVAHVLGTAIGKSDLQWLTLTNDQMKEGLEHNGVPPHISANLVELGGAIHSGILRADFDAHYAITGKVKIEDYAKDFAAAFNQN